MPRTRWISTVPPLLLLLLLLPGGCLDEKTLDGEYGKADATAPPDLAHDPLPMARIAAPADNAMVTSVQTVAFSGSATDGSGVALTGSSLQWASSIDGNIGSGTDFSRTLSVGTHVITLTATAGGGRTATAKITVVVRLL